MVLTLKSFLVKSTPRTKGSTPVFAIFLLYTQVTHLKINKNGESFVVIKVLSLIIVKILG